MFKDVVFSFNKTQVILVNQSKGKKKEKKIPVVLRTGDIQKAARNNLMNELPQSMVIVNGNKIWGKEGEKERKKNLPKSYLSLIR